MVTPAVVEQQAKLGVSFEESKAQRLKRQQARFRDRGGAFVPSTSNPLVDILLARTVSGESPSKARSKRLSPSKSRQAPSTHKVGTTTVAEESRVVAEGSKPKPPASRKRKTTAVKPEADEVTQPPPKRRGTTKGKKKTPGSDSDTEKPPLANTKSKRTSKGKGKQQAALSTSDRNSKTKTIAKAKPNSAKQVVEVLVSDDDQTLVEVPHKVKPHPKKKILYEDDGETDDDAPIVKRRAAPRVGDSKSSASGTKTTTHTKTEREKPLENKGGRTQDENCPKGITKKRLVLCDEDDDDDDDVAAPPTKTRRVAGPTCAKPETTLDPASRLSKTTESGEKLKETGKGKGKGKAKPTQRVAKTVVMDDERPLERASKPRKRKKEEDSYDDRPRKVVKFTETGPSHSSSQKLKENYSERRHNSGTKSRVEDESDAPLPKPVKKSHPRPKTSKGPPREVLERIKASAARHLGCVDSEPDELDCLS